MNGFRQLTLFGVLVTGLLLATDLRAEEWTQWRGNDRDGKSAETGLADAWPENGPRLLWQATNLGEGYSTPSSAEGLVYMIANHGMESEEVVALSLQDGTRKWGTKIGPVGKNTGPNYAGARGTPTIDGDFVYALGSDGDLACLDAKSGAIKWHVNLRSEFAGKPGAWAYAESPLIDGDVLICSPGGAEATVVALNKADGSEVWKSPLDAADNASFSSPIAATIDGSRQYVLYLSKGLVGLDADTGQPLWRYTNTSDKDANILTPVVQDNLVYSAAGRVGAGLVRVTKGSSEPEEIYFERSLPSAMGGAILVDDKLFGCSGQTLACIDYRSGRVLWQDRSIGASSLCYADGKIYLHGEDNQVAMIEASGDGYRELGKFTPANAPQRSAGKAWTFPIVVDGKLIVRDAGAVWCYDVRG